MKGAIPLECGGSANTTVPVVPANATAAAAFEACYGSVQHLVADRLRTICIVTGCAALVAMLCTGCAGRAVGARDAARAIRETVDILIALAGVSMAAAGGVIMGLSNATGTTAQIGVPLLAIGLVIAGMGAAFGIRCEIVATNLLLRRCRRPPRATSRGS
eukprot:SAG22_NODE_2762_length_2234_cov_1.135363_1_plen_159_part_10